MYIKIISCTNPLLWYYTHVGEVYEVIDEGELSGTPTYIVQRDGGTSWHVNQTDAEVYAGDLPYNYQDWITGNFTLKYGNGNVPEALYNLPGNEYPVLTVYDNLTYTHSESGVYSESNPDWDLFMIPKTVNKYVNAYTWGLSKPYDSPELAGSDPETTTPAFMGVLHYQYESGELITAGIYTP